MLENLRSATFSEHLNTKFQLHAEDSDSIELELIEVKDLESSAKQELFSVLFRGPEEPNLPQAIYKLDHESLGSLDLFLVPIDKDAEGMYYEAIFNRLPQ